VAAVAGGRLIDGFEVSCLVAASSRWFVAQRMVQCPTYRRFGVSCLVAAPPVRSLGSLGLPPLCCCCCCCSQRLRVGRVLGRGEMKAHFFTAPDGGSLGSWIDEERSQLCEAWRIAGLHETATCRTHIAAPAHGPGPYPPEGRIELIALEAIVDWPRISSARRAFG
jgi:hypothetical protein